MVVDETAQVQGGVTNGAPQAQVVGEEMKVDEAALGEVVNTSNGIQETNSAAIGQTQAIVDTPMTTTVGEAQAVTEN